MRFNKVAGIAASTFFSGALVLGLATSAGAAPDLGSLSGSIGGGGGGVGDCSTVEYTTPDKLNGWSTPGDETAATIGAVTDGPLGAGALTFEQSNKGTSLYKNAAGVKLSTLVDAQGKLTDIGYSYLTDGAAPALQLRILGANYDTEGDGFATIVWTPANGDGSKWLTATPGDSDQYWVTRDIRGVEGVRDGEALPRNERTTLKNIIAMNPDATLIEYGVQQTKENAATGVAVDGFVFGCTTTDFELVAPAAVPAQASPLAALTNLFGGLS
ncbi:hypothetical protein [Tomitella biformata]|uniref:hypothetical protein n=1 Tax=Tomitella biformata TaxID=630403 RepID=UPI00046656FD|nr:hypothetical protein [Tomitella biformata]